MDRCEQAAIVTPIDPFKGFPLDPAHRFPRIDWGGADLVDALLGKRLSSIAEKDLGFEQADDALGQ